MRAQEAAGSLARAGERHFQRDLRGATIEWRGPVDGEQAAVGTNTPTAAELPPGGGCVPP